MAVHLGCRDFITTIFWGVTHSPEKAVEGPMEDGLTKRWKVMQSALVQLLLFSWLWTIAIYLSIHPFIHPSTYLPVHLSICPSIHPPIHLSIHPSTHNFIHSSKVLESTVFWRYHCLSSYLFFKDIIWSVESDTWTNTLREVLSHTLIGVCLGRVVPREGRDTLWLLRKTLWENQLCITCEGRENQNYQQRIRS